MEQNRILSRQCQESEVGWKNHVYQISEPNKLSLSFSQIVIVYRYQIKLTMEFME